MIERKDQIGQLRQRRQEQELGEFGLSARFVESEGGQGAARGVVQNHFKEEASGHSHEEKVGPRSAEVIEGMQRKGAPAEAGAGFQTASGQKVLFLFHCFQEGVAEVRTKRRRS